MRIIDKLIAGLKHLRQPAGPLPIWREAAAFPNTPVIESRVITNGRAFKIVQNLGEYGLWSYLAYHFDHSKVFEPRESEIRYFPGHMKRPQYGKLFVLNSLRNAKAMLGKHTNRGLEIWAVDVRGEEAIPDGADLTDTRAFWNGERTGIPSLPAGTLVCNAVTLRERIA